MKALHQTTSFSGGVVSPKVDARVDQAKYNSWLRQSQNMVSYKTGGLTRAVGTKFIAKTKYATSGAGNNYAVNLIKFVFDPDTTFVLEFGDQYIRFYSNEQQVTINNAPAWVFGNNYVLGNFTVSGIAPFNTFYCIASVSNDLIDPALDPTHWLQQDIYEVPSPYLGNVGPVTSIYEAEVNQIQCCQVNDIIYIVHPSYPPYKLSRFGDTDWTMEQVDFLTPALLDQNATDTILTPSALQGNGITVTASAPTWVSAHYYTLANSVEVGGVIYDCIQTNVSGALFATDLAAGYWQQSTIFHSSHIGSTWQFAALRQSSYVQITGSTSTGFSTTTTSDTLQILGAYEVHTYGVWSATISIQRSLDGGITWDNVYQFVGASDRNADISGTAAQLGVYRIVITNNASPTNPGATNPRVVLEADDTFLYGLFQVTGVTNAYTATANVITQLTDTNGLNANWVSGTSYVTNNTVSYQFVNYICTNNVSGSTPPPQDSSHWSPVAPGGSEYWSEAAWSNYRGFPQAVTSFQQRMWYAASGFEPQRIWGTVTNDIENFALGDQTLATDGLAFDLNAPTRGSILWLTAQSDLFAGLMAAEWVINSGSVNSAGGGTGSAITPSALNAVEQGTYGSAPFVTPAIVGNAVFFAQRQADAIRQMLFSVYTAKYMSSDLSALADHLFASGIVKIDYQARWRHQGILWTLTQDGALSGLTYDLDQEVFGWCRRVTGQGQVTPTNSPIPDDNGFESLAILPGVSPVRQAGQTPGDDQVWVVANRLIGGVQTRYVELVNPNNWEETFTNAPVPAGPNLPDAFYVDSGTTILSPGSLTLTNAVTWIPNRYVWGLADGNPFGPVLVGPTGTVVLPNTVPANVAKIQIGLPIYYVGQPMRFDSSAVAGNTQARKKQAADWYVRVWNAAGGSLWNGTSNYAGWSAATAYVVGNYVIDTITTNAFVCVVPITGGNPPSQMPSNWAQVPNPVFSPPIPIPYPKTQGVPFSIPAFVSTPTDFRLPPALQPSPNDDPQLIITGFDALPITALGLFAKLDIISEP